MEILTEIIQLSAVCREHAESVDMNVAKTETDPRKMIFWNIHNRVKITEEILTFYEQAFKDKAFETENSERMLIVTKDMFIDIVSAIEKSMKDMLKLYPGSGLKEATLKKGSHLYLRNLCESCMDIGLFSEDVFNEWDKIIVLRNLTAHNNCISDRTESISIGDITVRMRVGRMMKGPLDTFIVLTAHIIELFYSWLMLMEERFKV